MKISLSHLRKNYNKELLLDSELNEIEKFINQEKFLKDYEQYLLNRSKWSKYSKIWLIVFLCIFIFSIVISNQVFFYIWLIWLIWVWIMWSIYMTKINFKLSYFKDFVAKFFDWMKYWYWKEYFCESIPQLKDKTWFVSWYDRIDKQEDSIEYVYNSGGKDSIKINWFEFQTSKKHKDKEWRTHRTVSNHYYVLKLKFLNSKYQFDNWIKIQGDMSDSLWWKVWTFILSLLVAAIIILIIVAILWLFPIFHPFGRIIIKILIILWFLWAIYVTFFHKDKKHVKLENIAFEKKFDVYGWDQIATREFLTPAMMDRILKFVTQIKQNRKYQFYFNDDEIYIFQSIWWWYMEVSTFGKPEWIFNKFIDFFVEIKVIKNLIDDLKLYYYDKGKYE